ncbi:MAG: hypothetical protein M3081_03645 [Gemmatimonadota bacterium]|nr:hypothetical protein [Gemmatimonadota bacterium]
MADGLLDGITGVGGAIPLVLPEQISAALDSLKDVVATPGSENIFHALTDLVNSEAASHGAADVSATVAAGAASVTIDAEHDRAVDPAATAAAAGLMQEQMQQSTDVLNRVNDMLQNVHDAQVHAIDNLAGGGPSAGAAGFAEGTALHDNIEYGVSAAHGPSDTVVDATPVDATIGHESIHVIDGHPAGDAIDGAADGSAAIGTGPRSMSGSAHAAPQQMVQMEQQQVAATQVVTDPSTTSDVSSIHDVHADTHVDHHDDTHTEEHTEEPPPEPAHEPVPETHTEPEAAHTDP